MKKLLSSLLMLGGLATSAFAATSGDIIIGFYASGDQGNGTEVAINAGSFSQFLAGDGQTFSISNFTTTDLVNTYSGGTVANWYDRTDLSWGVIGAIKGTQSGVLAANSYGFGAVKDTFFATAQNGFGNTTAQAPANSIVQPVYTYLTANAVNGVAITANAASVSGTFTNKNNATVNLDFGYFADGSVGLFNLMPGAAGSATQDLYETIPSGVAGTTGGIYKLGTFTLTSSGLSFTAVSAVPEPSTYAAIFGVVMLGFAVFRRRIHRKA